MDEYKILTNDPGLQIYKNGLLISGPRGGGTDPGTYPPHEYPAGPPPNSDAVHEFSPWPNNQADFDCTLGQYVQTVRLIVPQVPNPGKRCWIKVFGYPSGNESYLNSRMVKNNIIQRAWFDPALGLTIQLQEDFCVGKPVGDGAQEPQLWMPSDIIDFQFKTQLGNTQPVRCSVFTGEL